MPIITSQLHIHAESSWTPSHPSCPICLQDPSEKHRTPDQASLHSLPHNAWLPDHPVRLPCDHVFGIDCLAAWFQINPNCPLCRRFPMRAPSTAADPDYFSARFKALREVGVRELLTTEWSSRSDVLIHDHVNGLSHTFAHAAKLLFTLGVRITLGSRGLKSANDFVYPGVAFPLGADDAENFHSWVPTYMVEFQTQNQLDASTNAWLVDVSKMLESNLAAAYYASICRVFKQCNDDQTRRFDEGRVRTTYAAEWLLSMMETGFGKVIVDNFYETQIVEGEFDGMERSTEDKLYRVAQLAARGVLEMERRKTDITAEQERARKIFGFRYMDEERTVWRGDAESGEFLIEENEGIEVEWEDESESDSDDDGWW